MDTLTALKPTLIVGLFAALLCGASIGPARATTSVTAMAVAPSVSLAAAQSNTDAVPPPKATPEITKLLKTMNHASTWGHPDLFGEFAGMKRLFKGDYAGALKYFKIGARYADKLSQLSIGMMYYNGRGVTKDQATACAWLMLAAERNYPKFVAARNGICHALSSTQHNQAMATLDKLLPEYGDKVAKDRMKLALAKASAALTGSHVGFDFGAITASAKGSNAMISCSGAQYIAGVLVPTADCGSYSTNMLKAKSYFAARDAQWHGNVSVGALQQAPSLDAKTVNPDAAPASVLTPGTPTSQP